MRKKYISFVSILMLLGLITSCNVAPTSQPTGGESEPETPEDPDPEDPVIPQEVLVSSITFDQESYSLNIKASMYLNATVLPSNANNKKLTWESSDATICHVASTTGRLYGYKEGQVTITATSTDGSNISSSVTVNVVKIPVTDVHFSRTVINMHVGDEQNLTYVVSPNNATYRDMTFEMEDESVASYKANSFGSTTITASAIGQTSFTIRSVDNPNLYSTCEINVNPIALQGIYFNRDKIYTNVNSEFQLGLTFYPSDATNKNVSFEFDEAYLSLEGKVFTALKKGQTSIKVISEEGGYEDTIVIDISEEGAIIKTSFAYTYRDVYNNYPIECDITPSVGNPKLLVIPVWFTDSTAFINKNNRNEIKNDIAKTYFGESSDVGWRSVKTYYEQDSFGKLHIEGSVSDWYECGASYEEYMAENSLVKTSGLVNSAVTWYKKKYNTTLTEYDYDHNGYLDGVILVYAAPDFISLGKKEDETNYGNLWAYCYKIHTNTPDVDNPISSAFFWASYDFMYNSENSLAKTGKTEYGHGDNSNGIIIDTHTFIHEMGHMFGLNDYYDYEGYYYASGAFSMQDYNVGGHDPYSRMSLGWVDPYVISDNATLEIGAFEETGELIVVTNENSYSPFDEYMVVELYTPNGLNERDTIYQYNGNYPKGTRNTGVRIWHVDSRLLCMHGLSTFGLNPNNTTTNPYVEDYNVDVMMSNSSNEERNYISELKYYSQLFLIRNDSETDHLPKEMFDDGCLFKAGDKFDMYDYHNQFIKRSSSSNNLARLNNGKEFPFSIKVNSIVDGTTSITITRSK